MMSWRQAQAGAPQQPHTARKKQQQHYHHQKQEDLVLQLLLNTNPQSPYARELLRPFHSTCWAGWAAALRTIKALWLVRVCVLPYKRQTQLERPFHLELEPLPGVPGSHLVRVLAAADQAQLVLIDSVQLPGLLAALIQQQKEVEGSLQTTPAQVALPVTHRCSLPPAWPLPGQASGDMFNTSTNRSCCVISSRSSSNSSTMCGARSSSSSTRAVATAHPQPTAATHTAPKPCGAPLTTLGVQGYLTAATMQQLVELLDMWPRAQRLCHLDLARGCEVPTGWWVKFKQYKEALQEINATSFPTSNRTSISASKSSNNSGMLSPSSTSSSSSTTTTSGGSNSSRNHSIPTASLGAAAAPAMGPSSWRSSCCTLRCCGGDHLRLGDLSPLLGALQQLRYLRLENVSFQRLPPQQAANSLWALQALECHDTDAGLLWAAGHGINLRRIIINGNWMGSILIPPSAGPALTMPSATPALGHVTRLDLSHTGITNSGLEPVCGMTALRTLQLCDCPDVIELPHNISRLVRLEHLDLLDAGVVALPSSISMLTNLRHLIWVSYRDELFNDLVGSNLQLAMVWTLCRLQHLHVSVDQTSLPEGMCQLTALTCLSVRAKHLTDPKDLLATLRPLASLRRLEVAAAKLEAVPDEVTALTHLREVELYAPMARLSAAVRAFLDARKVQYPAVV